MKVSVATPSAPANSREAPVIGLDPPQAMTGKEEDKKKYAGKSVKIALKTNPAQADSETVDRYSPFLIQELQRSGLYGCATGRSCVRAST